MRNHRTTQELKSILVAGSPAFLPRHVESARRELSLRSPSEEVAFERKVRRSADDAAILGVVGVLGILLSLVLDGPPTAGAEPFPLSHLDFAVICLELTVGAMLVAGAVGTRRRRAIGPRLICVVLAMCLTYCVAFAGGLVTNVPGEYPLLGADIVFGAMGVAITAFFAWLFWLPFRFLSSSRVRTYCSAAVA